MSEEVDTPTDQPDPKAIVGGAFSAAAETDDQVVGFFALLGRALVTAADPDRSTRSSTSPAVAVRASTRRSTPSAPTARCSAS